jgi:hypothetical protein
MTTTIIVLGHRVIEIDVAAGDDSRKADVRMRVGEREWRLVEPGWRSLGYGIGSHYFYWWSARRLVILPVHGPPEVSSIETDEDILAVFEVSAGWLFVCETSARFHREGREISRLELPDVVTDFLLDGQTLILQVDTGSEVRVTIGENGLSAS